MNEHNNRVLEALNRYIGVGTSKSVAPHYAIMLNGDWGCGKTYFVNQRWLNNLSNDDKCKLDIIKVSLFGLKNVNELNDEIAHCKIIFQEHIESKEKARGIFKSVKTVKKNSVVRGSIALIDKVVNSKFGIGLSDAAKIFTRDWLSENKHGVTKVLILDDLERTKMDLKEVFGFVSSYIESTDIRVIFISNDSEINKIDELIIEERISLEELDYSDIKGEDNIKKYREKREKDEHPLTIERVINNKKLIETVKSEKSDENYNKIREKVIGETLRIEPNVNDAIHNFFQEIMYSEDEKNIIEPIVKVIREQLGYNNLRAVRQTLIKLKPLLDQVIEVQAYKEYKYESIEINGKLKAKEEYIINVCKFFVLLNMKKVMGDLEKENIWKTGFNHKFVQYRPLTQLEDEYDIWLNYLWNGVLDSDRIKKAVCMDMDVLTPQEIVEKDTIYKLQIGYWEYSKEDFYKLQSKLVKELEAGAYTEVRALLQAYALLVRFEADGILEISGDLDELFDRILNKIILIEPDAKLGHRSVDSMRIDFGGYRGYGIYYSFNEERVAKFLEKLKAEYKKDRIEENSITAVNLADSIISGEKPAYELLDNLDEQQPVLEWIGFERLWNVLDRASLMEQRRLFTVLKRRYGLDSSGSEEWYLVYKSELPIIESLVNSYSKRYNKAKDDKDNKVSMYRFLLDDAKGTLETFRQKIQRGEEIAKEKNMSKY